MTKFPGLGPALRNSERVIYFKWVNVYHKSAHFLVTTLKSNFDNLRNLLFIRKFVIFGNFFHYSYRLKNRSHRRPSSPPPALPNGGQIYAFYLPQFHQIPENDLWWGQGFTEWVNVKQAKPFFRRHYQPRLPMGDFYDLSNIEVMKEQAALAKIFGVDAFVVYFYWFNGKRLLEKPLDNVLKNPGVDFPFILCWANENWTRSWDGNDKEILIEQSYLDDWRENFYQDIVVYLRHGNYQRVNNEIILLIYRPDLIPNFLEFSETLKSRVKKDLSLDLLISAPNFFYQRNPTFSLRGIDFMYEFFPNFSPKKSTMTLKNGTWARSLSNYVEEQTNDLENLYPGVFTSWDNTARRGKQARIIHPSNPAVFREWLYRKLLQDSEVLHPSPSILFINAWNEWAEGAHLEPDKRFGYQWLWGVYDAKMKFSKRRGQSSTH